jgi:farnesyl diphosphate synthase
VRQRAPHRSTRDECDVGLSTSSLLQDALSHIAADVDQEFDTLLTLPGDARDRLYAAMRHATIGGGKRLRPLLVTATAALFHVDRKTALRVGTAVEAIHVYSLVHDDLPCMDDDDLRRGKPTVHRAFDEATAVLAGDSLHALAFEILANPIPIATHLCAANWCRRWRWPVALKAWLAAR